MADEEMVEFEERSPAIECVNCGAEYELEKSCPRCEKSLLDESGNLLLEHHEDRFTCNHCGYIHPTSFEGCSTCGTLIGGARNKKTLLPPILSASLCFVIPLFLTLFVGFELFITLIGYPSLYPSLSAVYLSPYYLLADYWLPSLSVSFLIVVTLFFITWKGFEFIPKEKIEGAKIVSVEKKAIGMASILTLILIISLGYFILDTGYHPSEIFTYILFGLVLLTGISQIDIMIEPRSYLGEEKVSKEKFDEVEQIKLTDLTKREPVEVKEPVEEEVKAPHIKKPPEEKISYEPPIKPVKVKKKVKKVKKPVKKKHVTCPVCGNKEEKEARICSECGESLVEEESKYPSSEIFQELEKRLKDFEAESEESDEEIMEETEIEKPSELDESIMNELDEELKSLEEETEEPIECPVCGAEFSRLEESCPECGEPVDSEEFIELIDCPICGAIFNHLEERCPECGEPVEEEDEEEDIFSELV